MQMLRFPAAKILLAQRFCANFVKLALMPKEARILAKPIDFALLRAPLKELTGVSRPI